jgi:transposase
MLEPLADLAPGTLRHKLPQLQQARPWQIDPQHQVLLGQIFAHMSYLEHSIQHLQLQIEQRLCPFKEAMQLRLAYSWHGGRLPPRLFWRKLAWI